MANTFFGLTIGKTGLYTYQAAINTTAHNASNIGTEGYSRQQTIRQAADPLSLSSKYGMVGAGVNVTSIESIRDAYYDTKYRYNNAILANQNTKSYYLDAIQSYFSEVNSDGTSDAMDNFFATLTGLCGDVSNTTIRTEVTSQGTTFTESLNYLYDSLQRTQIEINQEIKTISEQINAYAEEIATITRQINTIEVRGENANDLRDKRELLVDKLSEYANITATEISAENTSNQYIVKLDGAILVDTYEYYTLEVTASNTKVNEGDADGLYGLMWSSGQIFGSTSTTLGGKLQSLFELRDGNNNKNFNGSIDMDPDSATCMTAGASTLTVKGANIQNIAELNIPSEDGVIIIGNRQYIYDSFEITQENGEYVYTFNLKEPLTDGDISSAQTYADLNDGINFRIGSEIAYKGIPYYMAQINEFARTFAKDFNDIHKQGKDFYGNCDGLDFFTGTHAGTGLELELDADNTDPLQTYYALNAGNIKVANALVEDCKKIACGAGNPVDENGNEIETDSGIEDSTILKLLADLQNDVTMFKQGTPSDYFESFIAVMGVAGQEAAAFTERQEAIMASVEQQRMSISGVDQDEEALDLVKFKGAYDLCSKVVSTMNEIYDKLINETGV